jgi:peptidyl-prolyl cis-trans isomerase C
VQTEYGWHVILVDDHRVRAAPPLEEMRQELEGQLAEELIRERLVELRADAAIELFDFEGAPDEPADAGGPVEATEPAEPDATAPAEAAEPEEPAEMTDPAVQ